MSRINHRNLIVSAGIALFAAGVTTTTSRAVPVNGAYFEDPRCDVIPNQLLTHELGDAAVFPINEGVIFQVVPTNQVVCVPNDGVANDWQIHMTNVSGVAWKDLFFVGDLLTKVGNTDGTIADLTGAPNLRTDAFRIDGTLTAGINNNLLSELGGIPNNEIFENGEVWTFLLSNFIDANAGATPPLFLTPGQFAGSSPPTPGNPSNASILANPVPEPTTVGALTLIAAALLMRRRR